MTLHPLLIPFVFLLTSLDAQAQHPAKPRARDLGIPFDGTPGPLNAITDVKGVEVGFVTLLEGSEFPASLLILRGVQ